jgi:ubiquitin C-terminal hydrolase
MDTKEEVYTPKIGKCGFQNIGNTCYMNSVLQLLLHCKPLISFLIKRKNFGKNNEDRAIYEDFFEQATVENVARKERKRLNIDKNLPIELKKQDIEICKMNNITGELSKIVGEIVFRGSLTITPTTLKRNIDKKIDTFRSFTQHDAHEFLTKILDVIIEETGIETEPEINNVSEKMKEHHIKLEEFRKEIEATNILEEKKRIIITRNKYCEENKETMLEYNGLVYMKRIYKERYNPFIYQLYTFIINIIQCTECKNITTSYEHTPIIQLYVYKNLQDSFENFVKMETIENYKCNICKEERTINKICKLWRLPTTLFIHLKRFEVTPRGRRKNNTEIDIPTEIDMTEYCDETLNIEKKIKRKYKLKGFSNHMGNLNMGHYTADCECIIDNKTWYHFDDSSVKQNTNNTVDKSNAYILMYELI